MVNLALLDITLDDKATLEEWEAFARQLRPLASRDPLAQFKLQRAEDTIEMLRAEREGNLEAYLAALLSGSDERLEQGEQPASPSPDAQTADWPVRSARPPLAPRDASGNRGRLFTLRGYRGRRRPRGGKNEVA